LCGHGRGSGAKLHSFKTTTIEHAANTPTPSSSFTTSHPLQPSQSSQPLETIALAHSSTYTTSYSSSTATSSSSVSTNSNVRVNTSSADSHVTFSSPALSATPANSQVQPTPSNIPNPQGGLNSSTSHFQRSIVIGVSVALGLLLLLAGCLVFRTHFKRSKVVFHSEHIVQTSMRTMSVDAYPYSQRGGATSSTSFIHQAEGIPNPFVSDLDDGYSTQSEISFDDSASEVFTTFPGPASYTPTPRPAYTY